MNADSGLWAFIGLVGGLLLLGTVANVVLLLDIKIELSKAKRGRRRRGDDELEE